MLRFSYSSEDLYEVCSRLRSKSIVFRATKFALLCVGPVALFLWANGWCSIYLMVQLMTASVLLISTQWWRWLGRLLNRALTAIVMLDRTGKLPRDGSVEIALESSGIRWNSTYRNRFTPWRRVRRIIEDSDYVFVQVSLNTYHWVPKRAFVNAEDCTRFLARCRELVRLSPKVTPNTE